MCFSSAALATNLTAQDQDKLKTALEKYLAKQGDFCLGKFDWPIEVSESDLAAGTRDAVQMPVMEKLGLVVSSNASAMRKVGEKEETVPVKSYALTDAGRKFYLVRETESSNSGAETVEHHGDLCVAKLSLDKVIRWSNPDFSEKTPQTTAFFTYKVTAVKWAQDPAIQQVFPMIARIVKGEGSMQLQQRFQLSAGSWIPVKPVE